jgi:acetyl-CoA carboxylase biotin carboxylase subunit
MFRRLLIANRGEIAVRIIHACRELGVESIAVYSDADARAQHTVLADQAVRIGPPPASDSYLSIEAIVAAAQRTGAEAVHPGYGFLAENPRFASACESAGLTFVGPSADVIALMGSKITARALAQRTGVPIVPGITPDHQSNDGIIAAASQIGFPLLLKPSAGGGGIGMKVVRDAASLLPAIEQARREAIAAFGDGTLYVERLVQHPRHVEIQVLADQHGNVVHLFERECSIQRRHQKVVEETPSTALTPALRQRMGAAAIAAASGAGYQNAGTVEFLLEGNGDSAQFYFLEMNTRLQVEHPITEEVTGVDLVRAQIMIAAGERVPWTQNQLTQRGHAIEARVYAEDPVRRDLPQAGPLLLYREPVMPGIRVDAGMREGGEVPVHYDPMVAKVIARGETREFARRRLLIALRSFPILGIRTNVAFLIGVLEHPRFVSGDVDTGFVDAEGHALRERLNIEPSADVLAIAQAVPDSNVATAAPSGVLAVDPWSSLKDFRG